MNMKKIILSSLMLAVAFAGKAQITISNSSFPKVGDRIIMHNDTLINSALTPGAAGANQTWNFTSTILTGIQDTNTGVALSAAPLSSNYPGATIAINQGGGNYGYMKAGTTNLELLGFSGDLMGTGTPLAIQFNPSQIVAKAGMTFGSTYTNTSGFAFTLPGSAVGQSTFDSVRINFVQRIYNNFDAWGTVTTATGTYNCLRNNSLNVTTQIFDVKFPVLGWQLGVNADSSASGTYLFLDNTSALEVAGIDVDSFGTVTGARYRELGTVNGVAAVNESSINMNVFPSPANSASVILTSGLTAGNYTGEIYTVNGQLVNQLSLVAANGVVAMNLHDSNLSTGTYVASVRNAAGEVVVSRKFQFVK